MGDIIKKAIIAIIIVFSLVIMFSFVTACSLSAPAAPEAVNIPAVPGVTAPVRSAFPAVAVTEAEQYTGTIVWAPAASSFEGGTTYTATITLTPKAGYTLIGVPANFFTVAGADSVINAANSGIITAVFPATAPQVVVDISAVSGVTPPVRGAVPTTDITGIQQYTGTVSWAPANNPFTGNTVYTVTIILARKPGYTFTGVPANFFTVAGADSVSNAADSGVITAISPATATEIGDTITAGGVMCKVLTKSGADGTAEVIAGNYSGAVAIPETVDNAGVAYTVVSIGTNAFQGCSGLESVGIPESVTSIGESAFFDCSGLTSINIPGSVISIGNNAFYGCSKLAGISLPDGVTSIGNGAFCGCSKLTGIRLPGSVTSIGEGAFSDCSGLTSVIISGNVASIANYMFYNCSSLKKISLPDGLTSIGNGAFNGCSSLTRIIIPDGVVSIGDYAFYSCSGLTSISIPGSVISIGTSAFGNCTSLTSMSIGE